MNPIQSDTVLVNVLDWNNFLIPGIEKWGIGLPYQSNTEVLDQISACGDSIQYPKALGHVFIGYWIETSPNTRYQDQTALSNLSSPIN
jgi:arginyl-tRNA--protein-N-Asp/Glu arginylyltransferase